MLTKLEGRVIEVAIQPSNILSTNSVTPVKNWNSSKDLYVLIAPKADLMDDADVTAAASS